MLLLQETKNTIRAQGGDAVDTLHVVAFSGGVDSSLTAKIVLTAAEQLGQKTIACIGVSPSLAAWQLQVGKAVEEVDGLQSLICLPSLAVLDYKSMYIYIF